MRVRLRAPDEYETQNHTTSYPRTPPTAFTRSPPISPSFSRSPSIHGAFPRSPAQFSKTPPSASRLPTLDIRSPEFIEQRLENLKRKTSWRTYLDQYVDDHSDDDEENCHQNYPDIEETMHLDHDDSMHPGFFKSLIWSTGVVVLTPLWIISFPLLRHKGAEFWPFGCPSLVALYKRSISHLVCVIFALILIYYIICQEIPQWDARGWIEVWNQLGVMLNATTSCRAAVMDDHGTLIRELCAPIAVDVILLQAAVLLLMKAHRRWARHCLLVLSALMYFGLPSKVKCALQPLPTIEKIDPPYAMINEEITIAVDGKNLQPGGTIAWVAYWGCASVSSVETCELQYPSIFDMGVIRATFTSTDDFIPCYRNPVNPLKHEEFRCFEGIHVKIKRAQSIPGWSASSKASRKPSDTTNEKPFTVKKKTNVSSKRRGTSRSNEVVVEASTSDVTKEPLR